MFSPFRSCRRMLGRWSCAALLFSAVCWAAPAAPAKPPSALRICADPDDLPFSNRAKQGFDNRIAAMVARDLGRQPEFVWARSRRGFLREQFNKGACDVLMGVPVGMRGLAVTVPYYRSSYVFVTPERMQIASFSDPQLAGRRIGLQVLEENLSPPSLPLIRFGHAGQLVGFEAFGSEAGNVVRAVSDGSIGVAVVWGPVAGYFASAKHLAVRITSINPAADSSGVPMAYSLAFGLHKNDAALREAMNTSIAHLGPEIRRTLTAYHVPMLDMSGGGL